jgi:hypothetical protein
LERYFGKKVILLIDDYDTPIIEACHNIANEKDFSYVISLMRDIYNSVLMRNNGLGKALITGVNSFAKDYLLNVINLSDYRVDKGEYD